MSFDGNQMIHEWYSFKETVAPGTGVYFRLYYKIKVVLSVEPLMVLKFVNFIIPDIFKMDFLTALLKKLTNFCRFL